MEDIFKSGLLGLALIGALALASANSSESKNSINDYTESKIEEVTMTVEETVTEEAKIKSKKDFHIPL